ncbi:HPP family protein [uncultured Apibacter sp.]|uniref:HPP family protein n=2 Tax=uncultured Apibacter sp. TaxID=1778616 RepID=UPI0025E40510|nr:HPP family protein [uncultured Apibacter sp.]
MLLGNEWYSMSLGVGLAIAIMQLTKTTHPPAGADPLVIITGGASWNFIINPVLSGAVVLVIVALIFNNLSKTRKYSKFWV